MRHVAAASADAIILDLGLSDVEGIDVTTNCTYVCVYLNQLRQKIESNAARPKYLITEPGVRYRLVAEG